MTNPRKVLYFRILSLEKPDRPPAGNCGETTVSFQMTFRNPIEPKRPASGARRRGLLWNAYGFQAGERMEDVGDPVGLGRQQMVSAGLSVALLLRGFP
jgi:hypothetical protein